MKFFTADLHLDHERSVKFPGRRGFLLPQWQEMIIGEINKRTSRGDTLYILGDFAFKPNNWRSKINLKNVILIKGNHCPSLEQCRLAFGKDKVYDTLEIKMSGVKTFLSHYPHLIWPSSHYGSFHLYGHVHDSRTDFWNEIPYLRNIKSLDVCPESYKRHFGDFGIFDENQIYEILNKKTGHDPVEWYRDTYGPI